MRKASLLLLLSFSFLSTRAQTYLGDYTDYVSSDISVTVRAGSARVRFIFYEPTVLRVDYYPNPGAVPDSSFSVIRDSSGAVLPLITETDSTVDLMSPSLVVTCSKFPLRFSFLGASGTTLLAEPASGGLGQDQAARLANFVVDPSEHFYGTGERGIGLDLRGHSFASYNTQVYGYNSALSTMNINIPFLASTRGYGIFFDNTFPGNFDIAAANSSQFQYRADGGELTFYLLEGETIPDQLERYTWLTGRQPIPPRWTFGYIQSKFGYRNESEARSVVQMMRQEAIPCDAIVIDAYWFNQMGDLSWNSLLWPSPYQMMSDFLNVGIKSLLITEPYFTSLSTNWSELVAGGYLGHDTSGLPYILDNWWSCSCDAGLLDMTNPAARDWFWTRYPAIFGNELAGIWTDLGEPERHPTDMLHTLGTTARVHNIYNLLWAEMIFDGYTQFRPDERLFNLTRSGFAGIQRYGVATWSGDVSKSYVALSLQPRILLNMGMSGMAYHNSDIGGFCCGYTSPELYIRWMQLGAFCPVTRAHGAGPAVGGQDTEPWAFGQEAEDIAREYLRLRYQLLPYIYTLAHENYETGMPLARPLLFEDASDMNLFNLSASYLWGDELLVSPVVQSGQTSKDVYLPEGTWISFWTDQVYSGRQTVSIPTPLEIMPIFVKAGSIVPRQPVMDYTNQNPLDTLMLSFYPGMSGGTSFTLYEDDGETLEYQSGAFALTTITQEILGTAPGTSMNITLGPSVGSYAGKLTDRVYLSDVHGVAATPAAVTRNGLPIPERASYSELREGGDGFYYDGSRDVLFIQTPAGTDSSYELFVENILLSTSQTADVPVTFRLEQNYPNPFNGRTDFRFSISALSHVSLKIYDILGREIATVVDEVLPAGNHTREWEAANRASGVYFSRLTTPSGSMTQKLVLAR